MAEGKATRDLFLWCMSVIYLFAFVSLFVQIPGLYGDNGILPAKLVLQQEADSFQDLVTKQPTLLRLLPRVGLDLETGMDFLCLGGAILSFVAMVSRDQRNCVVFAALWAFYLSMFQVGQTFLWFQWDVLLLEVGFLTILIAPLNCFGLQDGVWHHSHDHVTFWLVKWLLFRLTFASGVVKLTSNSASWWSLTEMTHHYESQLLPTPVAWYFHRLPTWVQQLTAVFTLTSQIAVSLFFFSPIRSQRIFAFYSQCLLLMLMMLTGNYSFYTLLILTLCLSLVDDEWLKSWTDCSLTEKRLPIAQPSQAAKLLFSVTTYGVLVYGVVRYFSLHLHVDPLSIDSNIAFTSEDLGQFLHWTVPLTILIGAGSLGWQIASTAYRTSLSKKNSLQLNKTSEMAGCGVFSLIAVVIFLITLVPHAAVDKDTQARLPQPLHDWYSWTSDNYQLTSSYDFFRRTSGELQGRAEVILEGSDVITGDWKEYNFRFKPGDIDNRLPFITPHQPRLDGQMWSAAVGHYDQHHWILNLVYRLLNNQRQVLELMGDNPFQDDPPKYIRATLYSYQYTSRDTDSHDSSWWTREAVGEYLPPVSLDDPSFVDYIREEGLLTEMDETKASEPRPTNFLRSALECVRYVSGQGNGCFWCLALLCLGFLLSLLDPSIKIVSSEQLVNGIHNDVCATRK